MAKYKNNGEVTVKQSDNNFVAIHPFPRRRSNVMKTLHMPQFGEDTHNCRYSLGNLIPTATANHI